MNKINVILYATYAMCFAAGGNALAFDGRTEAGDPTYVGEILASAPLMSGEGSMEIVRTNEDGIDGVAVSVTAPIGTRLETHDERTTLPYPDRVALTYRELTGHALTKNAFDALVEIEAREMTDTEMPWITDISVLEAPAKGKQPVCPNLWTYSNEAYVNDCYVHGPMARSVGNVRNACLLTAAISGDHTMQLSYKSINGNYYNNYKATVKQGYYRATQQRTGIHRTRKGQIFNASKTDYSRFEYQADNFGVLFNFGLTDCVRILN